MLPFRPNFRPGYPVYGEVIYAVKKALVTGALKEGDAFPSVRQLSQELRINPNTAHKVVAALVQEGLLEVRSGTGTFIAPLKPATGEQRRALLNEDLEAVVVQARRLSMDQADVIKALEQHWKKLSPRHE